MPHAGIACCKQHSRTIGEIIAHLVLIRAFYEPDEMRDWAEFS